MFNRREFLRNSAVAAGAVTRSNTSQAAETRANPSGVRGYDYRLPKFKPGTRLVFQGDSITDMNWGRNEGDRNHYLCHSYVYLIASRLGVECAADKLNFFNRGVGSNSMPDLQKRWQQDSIDSKADLLSVLFGVNDVNRMLAGATPKDWESDKNKGMSRSQFSLTLKQRAIVLIRPANRFLYKSNLVAHR
ncbi:MAG: GDSL-type esterase/lipase family protein [Verrucomicrobia bacterium]|nr:GDSL-type esterase/lipase family protein [Verrucomicrobiota bacterium]